jgi:hypothetical protein
MSDPGVLKEPRSKLERSQKAKNQKFMSHEQKSSEKH